MSLWEYQKCSALFFCHCQFCQVQRNKLLNAIMPYQNPSLSLFLYGNSSLSRAINSCIFEHVQKFIVETRRFET